ncbi:ArsR/SmtB family transcription factor [Streptomyces sviceus]|uniref:ArsR/SmtB family transcription factor n=1 Tax=Streptomyces sviceus TaxID=285530 RepID=UPI003D9F09E0
MWHHRGLRHGRSGRGLRARQLPRQVGGIRAAHPWREPASGANSPPLNVLLGPTRAAILRASATGSTTTEAARRAGVTPTTASHHTAVLRDSGLITSHRPCCGRGRAATDAGSRHSCRQREFSPAGVKGRLVGVWRGPCCRRRGFVRRAAGSRTSMTRRPSPRSSTSWSLCMSGVAAVLRGVEVDRAPPLVWSRAGGWGRLHQRVLQLPDGQDLLRLNSRCRRVAQIVGPVSVRRLARGTAQPNGPGSRPR